MHITSDCIKRIYPFKAVSTRLKRRLFPFPVIGLPQQKSKHMKFVLFFFALFVTIGCLEGGLQAKHPLHNFGAVIVLWVISCSLTEPGRRRRQYLRKNGN